MVQPGRIYGSYFDDDRQGTVGVIESTSYINSQMLQTYMKL